MPRAAAAGRTCAAQPAETRLLELVRAVRLAERYLSVRPASAVGRPQAARGDRPRLRRRPPRRRLRRADLGARRLGPGRDPQPARRAAGPGEGHLPLHLARPRRRALPLRPHRRALSRPPDGARARGGRLRRARTIPTPRRCSPPSRRSTAAPRADPARGRDPERRRPAHRAACSTPAARASSATICETQEPPLREVARRPPDALPHPRRGAAPPTGAGAGRRRSPDAESTRCVLEETVVRSASASSTSRRPAGRGRSCACTRAASATPTRTRSTAPRRRACPAVLGHEGAGVVEAVGPGVRRVAVGRPRGALVGPVVRRVRGVPARAAAPVLRPRGRRWGRAACSTGPRASRARARPIYHYSLPLDVRERARRAGAIAACRSRPTCRSRVAGLVGCAVSTGARGGLADRRRARPASGSRSSAAAASASRRCWAPSRSGPRRSSRST